MISKIAQLLLFGVLPYLALTFTTPDMAAKDDAAAVQEPADADMSAEADEPAEPGNKA